MADVAVVSKYMSMLPGARQRDAVAGEAGVIGDAMQIDANGKAVKATDAFDGVAVAAGSNGAAAFSAGDMLTLAYHGPVAGFSGATPGTDGFVSGNAGKVADGGTVKIGRFWSENVLVIK